MSVAKKCLIAVVISHKDACLFQAETGGAINAVSISDTEMELLLWRCQIHNCSAQQQGGALMAHGSGMKLVFQSCSISNSRAGTSGKGVCDFQSKTTHCRWQVLSHDAALHSFVMQLRNGATIDCTGANPKPWLRL